MVGASIIIRASPVEEMAVWSENVAEAPGTRDRAVRGALEAIGEAGSGSGLKEREAVWKERLREVRLGEACP